MKYVIIFVKGISIFFGLCVVFLAMSIVWLGMVNMARDVWCPSWLVHGRTYECRDSKIWNVLTFGRM